MNFAQPEKKRQKHTRIILITFIEIPPFFLSGMMLKLCGANEAQPSLYPNERLVMRFYFSLRAHAWDI